METTVRVRVLRAFWVRADAFAAGAIVALAPLDAAGVLESARGVVDSPEDMKVIAAAVRQQTDRIMKTIRAESPSSRRGNIGDPWRSVT